MSDVALIPVDPTSDEVQFLEDRIYEFNSSTTDITDGELFALFVREGGRIVAGICGNTWGGTCELRQFWVEESQRHRGLGTKLFQAAEQEARRRGCTQIRVARAFDDAMGDYQRTRDQHALPMYEFTCKLAALEPPPPDMQQLVGAIHGNQKATDGFVQMNAGTISPAAFSSPENIGAIMAAAGATT